MLEPPKEAPSLAQTLTQLALRGRGSISALDTIAGGGTPAVFGKMTIKQLIVQALLDAFPNGATANDIRNFIRSGYGRDIESNSFRPQLHRLKLDGILGQNGLDESWNLPPEKRKACQRYNHPGSRAMTNELDSDEAREPQAPQGGFPWQFTELQEMRGHSDHGG